MIYIILGFVVLFFLLRFLKCKYGNPYQLIFVFGKKGAGKSCLMVREMKKHLKRGWNVYTDMEDCILPGVRIIKTVDLKTFVPERNSLLCLDEVGISFDNRNFKNFSDGYRDFFKFQRKYRVKCIVNSQSFDIDLKIRAVVDSMILQTNWLNCISISRPILRSLTVTEPTSERESRIADRLRFAPIWRWRFYWMPRYFKYFDSFGAPPRDTIPYVSIPNPKFQHVSSRKYLKFLEKRLNRPGRSMNSFELYEFCKDRFSSRSDEDE